MAAEPVPYQRLPGTGYRRLLPGWAMVLLFFVVGIFVLLLRGKRVQLWLGSDHLLIVEWDGYREYYRRIFFRDIQSVTVRRTSEGTIMAIVLGSIVLFAGGLAVAVRSEPAVMITMLILAGGFGLLLLLQLGGGATCVTELRTAVQSVELVSLHRVRHTRAALGRIRPRILEAQGGVASVQVGPDVLPAAGENIA